MKVVVRYYNTLRGVASDVPESHLLDAGATIRDLLNRLTAVHTGLLPFQSSWLVALNNEYAGPDSELKDGDTVDLMPPVSGG